MATYIIDPTQAEAPNRASQQTTGIAWMQQVKSWIVAERANLDEYGGNWLQLATDRGMLADGQPSADAALAYYNNLGIVWVVLTTGAGATAAEFKAAFDNIISEANW